MSSGMLLRKRLTRPHSSSQLERTLCVMRGANRVSHTHPNESSVPHPGGPARRLNTQLAFLVCRLLGTAISLSTKIVPVFCGLVLLKCPQTFRISSCPVPHCYFSVVLKTIWVVSPKYYFGLIFYMFYGFHGFSALSLTYLSSTLWHVLQVLLSILFFTW